MVEKTTFFDFFFALFAIAAAIAFCYFFVYFFHSPLLVVKIICRSLLQETYEITDTVLVMTGATDQTNNFGQNATILSNSYATITHDNTNNRYVATKTNNNGLVLLPITALTGLNNIIFEFDMYAPSNSTINCGAGIGNCGFYQLAGTNNPATSNIFDQTDYISSNTGHYDNEWVHHKFIITNGVVTWTAKRQNDSEIINRTHNVSISSTTKIGLSIGYGTNATCYFKNIIVKAL